MRPASINSLNYQKNIARKNRRRFLVKSFVIMLIILMSGVGSVYLLFFSSMLRINETDISGLKTVKLADISSIVEAFKNQDFLGKIKPELNILFFDTDSLRQKILSEFKVIESVRVIKEFPHKLIISITERTAIGTWCFSDSSSAIPAASCHYFDSSGMIWGNALRSSGSLLLNVEDLRSLDRKEDKIDAFFFEPIKKAIDGLDKLNIKIKKIEIQDSVVGDFRIYTGAGYYLILNNETDIQVQLQVLKILLNEKGNNFNPQYIDLRIEGRVYYK